MMLLKVWVLKLKGIRGAGAASRSVIGSSNSGSSFTPEEDPSTFVLSILKSIEGGTFTASGTTESETISETGSGVGSGFCTGVGTCSYNFMIF